MKMVKWCAGFSIFNFQSIFFFLFFSIISFFFLFPLVTPSFPRPERCPLLPLKDTTPSCSPPPSSSPRPSPWLAVWPSGLAFRCPTRGARRTTTPSWRPRSEAFPPIWRGCVICCSGTWVLCVVCGVTRDAKKEKDRLPIQSFGS